MAADLTALHRAHEEAARSEAVRALGEMVGAVAHEVRNPLFAMGATLDALRGRFGVAPDQQPLFETLQVALDELGALMRDLLEFGRPSSYDRQRWRVAALVEDVVRACRDGAARAAVRLEDVTADQPAEVTVDGVRFEVAVRNLVDNAIQHSPRGGDVRVEPALATLPSGPAVEVSVLDRGPGFAGGPVAGVRAILHAQARGNGPRPSARAPGRRGARRHGVGREPARRWSEGRHPASPREMRPGSVPSAGHSSVPPAPGLPPIVKCGLV
jgi:K+-sensing histidine kinase KdpD